MRGRSAAPVARIDLRVCCDIEAQPSRWPAMASGSEVVVSVRVAQGVLGGGAVAGNEPVQGVGEDVD